MVYRLGTKMGGRKERERENARAREKERDYSRAPIILEILRRDSETIYLRCTSERVQQNTIGETGQRRVKKWKREVDEEEEESRRNRRRGGDEEDTER